MHSFSLVTDDLYAPGKRPEWAKASRSQKSIWYGEVIATHFINPD